MIFNAQYNEPPELKNDLSIPIRPLTLHKNLRIYLCTYVWLVINCCHPLEDRGEYNECSALTLCPGAPHCRGELNKCNLNKGEGGLRPIHLQNRRRRTRGEDGTPLNGTGGRYIQPDNIQFNDREHRIAQTERHRDTEVN